MNYSRQQCLTIMLKNIILNALIILGLLTLFKALKLINFDSDFYFLIICVSLLVILINYFIFFNTLKQDINETILLKNTLESANTSLYDLINAIPMIAYLFDSNGNYILGNKRAEKFLSSGVDYTLSGEILQLNLENIITEIKKENAEVLCSNKHFVADKLVESFNGEKYWYRVTRCPLTNSDGNIYAIATFANNIHVEKKMQEERETYIATLSHDLKTPAVAQVRALELLLSGQMGSFTPEQEEILKLTLDSCNYMYDMVYTLLSTCKFENGDIRLNYSVFDINLLIKEAIKETSYLTKENQTCVIFKNSDNLSLIRGDRIELKRVIINLLSNGISYAYSNSKIFVNVVVKNSTVNFTVTNFSPYIPKDTLGKLFRKYVSHSEKFKRVGVGLGLYLSKIIVELHNGDIIAKSSKSNKNTFGFSIPIGMIDNSNTNDSLEKIIDT